MGDAFTAVADDEYTLFYNPAALGRHKTVSISFINPDASITDLLSEQDRFKDFPSRDAVAIANRVLGLPLHLHIGGTPGIKIYHFGMNLFANVNSNIVLRNAIHPSLDVNYRYDRGFIAGYGFTIGEGFKPRRENHLTKKGSSKKGKAGNRFSFGVGVKSMNRQGLQNNFDLFGLELLDIISNGSSSDFNSLRKELGYSMGSGVGVDSGIEYSWSTNISQFNVGLSWLDIGDTRFRLSSGSGAIPKQDSTLNFGMAFKQDFWLLDYTLSFDVHPINQPIDFGRKLHAGAEIGIPFINLMGGYNGGYISYGAEIEFWPIKIMAGFYTTELGSFSGQEKGSRALIYLSILNFAFDS